MSDAMMFYALFGAVFAMIVVFVYPAGRVLGHWRRPLGELVNKMRVSAIVVGVVGALIGAMVLRGQTDPFPLLGAAALVIASGAVIWLAMRAPRPRGEPFKSTVFVGIGLFLLVRFIRLLDGVHSPGPDPRAALITYAWIACIGITALVSSVRANRRTSA